jgi:hypothetical protein
MEATALDDSEGDDRGDSGDPNDGRDRGDACSKPPVLATTPPS